MSKGKKTLSELMAFIAVKTNPEDDELNVFLPIYYFDIKTELECLETLKKKIESEKTRVRNEIRLAQYHKDTENEFYYTGQLNILEKLTKGDLSE